MIIGCVFIVCLIVGFAPRIRVFVGELFDWVGDLDCDCGELDLVADLAMLLSMMVIVELLGLLIDDWCWFVGWSEAIVNLGNTIAGGDAARVVVEFARVDVEMIGYFVVVTAVWCDWLIVDLISRLVIVEFGGEALDDAAITRFCQLLLVVGIETTINLIDNAVVCFAAHSDQLAIVRVWFDLLL